jgi:hypothetical protein
MQRAKPARPNRHNGHVFANHLGKKNMNGRHISPLATSIIVVISWGGPASAQQVAGVPGSPSATQRWKRSARAVTSYE